MPVFPDDAAQWLPGARAGSGEALGRVLESCRGYLLQIARREIDPELQAKEGASDLVQDTFLEAQRDFNQFHGNSQDELRKWLRRLLLNNLANFQRHYRGTDKRQIARETPLEAGPPGAGISAGSSTPSSKAAAHEQAEALKQALDRLPEDYRRVITLRYAEGREFEEIGRLMDRSANAACKLWVRALERLQQELGISL